MGVRRFLCVGSGLLHRPYFRRIDRLVIFLCAQRLRRPPLAGGFTLGLYREFVVLFEVCAPS